MNTEELADELRAILILNTHGKNGEATERLRRLLDDDLNPEAAQIAAQNKAEIARTINARYGDEL